MKTITINVKPNGDVEIEDEKGMASDITADIEKALGIVAGKKQTCSTGPKTTTQKLTQKVR